MKTLTKFTRTIGAFAMTVVLAVPAVLAQSPAENVGDNSKKEERDQMGGRWNHFRHRRAGLRRAFEQLNLTEDQKAQIKRIRENHRENVTSLKNQIRAKQQELRQSVRENGFDESAVRQKLTDIANLKTNLMHEMYNIRQETASVLTPEQRSKLEQMREEFKAKHKNLGANR